jgi:hypothetical protein
MQTQWSMGDLLDWNITLDVIEDAQARSNER